MLEELEQDLYEIQERLEKQYIFAIKVKSIYLQKLLLDNINKTCFIIQCINSICLHTIYMKSTKRKIELFSISVKDIQKDFKLSDEEMLKIIKTDKFKEAFEISNSYAMKNEQIFIKFNIILIEFAVLALKRDYSMAKENINIILDNIFDFIPILSEYKNIIKIIKDVASCVENLVETQQKYLENIKKVDIELNEVEEENKLLTEVFNLLYRYRFVQENFGKTLKDFEEYID